MQQLLTRGICRQERRETRWSFSGWATATGAENTVRPRGYYRTCGGCSNMVLTLADVDDALALCRAVLSDWLRRTDGADRIDTENVLGELFAHVWYLYAQKWVPSFGNGDGTFTGYATGVLRKKIHRFVVLDVGDPTEDGRHPKAHSRSLADSYEGVVEQSQGGGRNEHHAGGSNRAERGGLDFALGLVPLDPTGDSDAGGAWMDTIRDRGPLEYLGG